MGCASSTDTGTQYASLGHHGQQGARRENNTTQQQTQLTQNNQQTTKETTQQPNGTEPPPPYDDKPKPIAPIVATPRNIQKTAVAQKTTVDKSGMDWDNTDGMMTLGLPNFDVSEYSQTDIGTYERALNFRTFESDFPSFDQPDSSDGQFVDYEFPLEVAFPKKSNLEWKRPAEFLEAPVLFSDGSSRFDIGQGEVGTCWFLAMVSNIADKPRLLRRVIPDGSYNAESGIFHCKFWRFGAWIDTYIDDCLPVTYGDQLAGANSATDKNEIWVALLEKAFAKVYGSYDEVEGGLTADSFMNLTSGVAEMIEFKKKKVQPRRLFRRLHNAFQCPTTMVGCSVPNKNDGQLGLVGGHAYSMSGAFVVGDALLLRIRNPWGKGEWKGAWSDGSPEWANAPSDCVPPPNQDDGEFYMDIHDFMNYFDDVTICNLTPDFDRDGNPNMLSYTTSIYGNWREGKMGGYQRKTQNPMYHITVGEEDKDEDGKVPLVVQIVQRLFDRDDVINIRCDLFKVLSTNGDKSALEQLGDKSNMYMGNTQVTYRFLVEPGSYVAIPSTMEEGYDGREFLVRFFSAGPLSEIRELECMNVMAGRGRGGDEPAGESNLRNTCSSLTAFRCGYNAGGQVSCDGFANNPQYLLTVNEEQTIRVEVMQPEKEEGFPIGFKLWEASSDVFPAERDWLLDNYENCVRDSEGGDGKFQYGTATDSCYNVSPGTYLLLLHADGESDENDIAVSIYSEHPVGMQEAHT